MASIFSLTLGVRDLEALRAVSLRRGWDFRPGQRRYRCFGIRPGDRAPAGVSVDEPGCCAHAIGIPGCAYELGLIDRGGHFALAWDDGPEGGLQAELGPGGGKFWQAYVPRAVQRAAFALGHCTSWCFDGVATLRVRVCDPGSGQVAHVRVRRDGDASVWTFGPDPGPFRYLTAALGTVRSEETILLCCDPASP